LIERLINGHSGRRPSAHAAIRALPQALDQGRAPVGPRWHARTMSESTTSRVYPLGDARMSGDARGTSGPPTRIRSWSPSPSGWGTKCSYHLTLGEAHLGTPRDDEWPDTVGRCFVRDEFRYAKTSAHLRV
jgi:hypothetical protein